MYFYLECNWMSEYCKTILVSLLIYWNLSTKLMKLSKTGPYFSEKNFRTQIKESPISLIDIGQDSVPKHVIKENPGQSRRGGLGRGPLPSQRCRSQQAILFPIFNKQNSSTNQNWYPFKSFVSWHQSNRVLITE